MKDGGRERPHPNGLVWGQIRALGGEAASLGPEPRVEAAVLETAKSAERSGRARLGRAAPGWGRWARGGGGVGGVSAEPAEGAGPGRASRSAHPPCRLADGPPAVRLGPRPQPTGAAAGTQDAPLRRLRCSNMAAR